MSKPLNILLVEDSEDDSLLLIRELRRGGYDPVYERVETPEAMRWAFERQTWDVVISDYILPKFSGLAALNILKESEQDIPFIIVSGNIGEDIAVNAMRAGAQDYIIKGNLTRLIPAVERELRESEIRRERKSAEEQLQKTRQRLFETLETIREGFFLLDRDWRFAYVNAEAARLWEKSPEELIGRIIWDVAPDAVGSLFDERYHKAVKERVPVMFEALSPLLGIWVEVRAYPSAEGLAVYFHDITERKQAEEKIAGLTRFYLVLANVNEAIVRRKDRQALFDEVCRIIVETGGFRLAWVGLVDPVSREVRPASSYGATKYLDGIRIIAADVPEGRGPTGRALVEARHIINTDFYNDENMKPWIERARAHGIRSSSAFPLKVGGEVIGALTIYADRPSFFTVEEVTLFLALSDNISFALDAIENEQKRMEAISEIRRSEAEVRDLYNNAPCGYHSLDGEGTIVRINDTELSWLGYRRDEVEGKKKIYEFYTPGSAGKFNETFPKFVESGSTTELEVDIVRKDGTTFPVFLNAAAIRDRNGNFMMSRSTMFDMTERKELERRTQTTNMLLNLFTQKFNRNEYLDEVCKLLRDWSGCRHVGIRIVNPANSIPFEACCGYDQAFLKQESGLSLATDQCICPRIIAGKPELTDLKSMTAHGSFYSNNSLQFEAGVGDSARNWYRGVCMKLGFKSLAVIPIMYRDKPIGAVHLSDEQENRFTLRKVEFIEQLAFIIGEAVFRFGIEEDQMRLASAVDSAADGVVVTESVAGTIQYVNPAFEQITGYSKEEAIGRTLHILDSGKQDEAFYQELRDVIRREGVWQGRLYNKKKDGTIYLEDCTFSPVRDQSGKVINYVWVKRDVTDKVRLESIAESVNMMNNIGYIFSGVRHEIGNPVNSAKMILSVLQYKLEKASKESIKESVDRSLVEIGRVEQLLKSLKNFNLYENPELQNLNLVTFMQGFMNLVAEDFERRGIQVKYKVDPDAEWAFVDSRALQQVLMNLVTNAADALADRNDPTISILVKRETGLIHVIVGDNGKGMTDKQLQDLFKPFYTSKPHGTGLGLVIVKKMLARMNCEIAITSALDEGTMVDISIPEASDGKQK